MAYGRVIVIQHLLFYFIVIPYSYILMFIKLFHIFDFCKGILSRD